MGNTTVTGIVHDIERHFTEPCFIERHCKEHRFVEHRIYEQWSPSVFLIFVNGACIIFLHVDTRNGMAFVAACKIDNFCFHKESNTTLKYQIHVPKTNRHVRDLGDIQT